METKILCPGSPFRGIVCHFPLNLIFCAGADVRISNYQKSWKSCFGHVDQSINFSSFSDNAKFWDVIQHKRKDVLENGKQVHWIERLDKEFQFPLSASKTDEILHGEIDSLEKVKKSYVQLGKWDTIKSWLLAYLVLKHILAFSDCLWRRNLIFSYCELLVKSWLPLCKHGLILGFPQDGTSRGTSRDKPGRDVPLSLCPGTIFFLVPVSLCPGTRAGANVPGQKKNELKFFK